MTALLLANLVITSALFSSKSPRLALWLYLLGAFSVLVVIVAEAEETYEHPSPISIFAIVATLVFFTVAVINVVKKMQAPKPDEALDD